jgi:hypothetical protein
MIRKETTEDEEKKLSGSKKDLGKEDDDKIID